MVFSFANNFINCFPHFFASSCRFIKDSLVVKSSTLLNERVYHISIEFISIVPERLRSLDKFMVINIFYFY